MSSSELQELHQRAQLKYAQFSQGQGRRKMQEHKAMANLAQAEAIVSILEQAPKSVKDYKISEWSRFHSLPLHVATKARLDHKIAMEKLDWPKWKKALEEA